MATSNNKKSKKKKELVQRQDKNEPYKKGDYCFFVSNQNKIHFAEVHSAVFIEDTGHVYTLIDQTQFRFVTVHHDYCGDSELELKDIKR